LLAEHLIKRSRLRQGARIAVHDKVLGTVFTPKTVGHEFVDQVIRDKLAALDERLCKSARRRPQANGFSKDVSGSDMNESEPLAQELCLGAFAAARRADQDKSHDKPVNRINPRSSPDSFA
jgi:hypothetical protein